MDRAALARKYRTLAQVRRSKRSTGQRTPRESMRALAREFPGSLRELDALTLEEIDRRAAALEAGPAEPWMEWMAAYHQTLSAALRIKATRGEAMRLAESLGVTPGFAAACARPPGGRILALVVSDLAARFGVPEARIRAAIFPRRPTPAEVEAERRQK